MAGDFDVARRQLQACYTLILRESPPWWSGQSSVWHVLGTLCAAIVKAAAEREKRPQSASAAAGHWRRGLVLAKRARDPMLEALHTRDLLKHSQPAMMEGVPMAAAERARLLESGSFAAKRVADPELIAAFAQLELTK